ncbi:MAG TPA: 3-deoxy-D-manno-octulosonic acid kinase [Woeseiaceae bacterium]|nr:3-deoxy-D-manno-octulosonic acid kinase [Woeseiaceae bacterium]
MKETVVRTGTGAILYDRSLPNHISADSFAAAGWAEARPVEGRLRSAGRGNTLVVGDGTREFVLKHYVRGGLPARFLHDRYLWLGEARTRAFAEWRLLARLRELELPVPPPAAARYVRHGAWYTADLLTVRVPGIRPLSMRLTSATDAAFWEAIGAGIRRFHDAGVHHADLNAYNVQVDADDRVFLLDFDRGELRSPGPWQRANLARLRRSLDKLKRMDESLHFDERDWARLVAGYGAAGQASASRSA